jgi:hypothetical protein
VSTRGRSALGWLLVLVAIIFAWSGGTTIWEWINGPTVPAGALLAEGPGGPILLVLDPHEPFGSYLAEILRAEGITSFESIDVGDLGPDAMAGRSVILLPPVTLDEARAEALEDWVRSGGSLIAFRPQQSLLPLFGLAPAGPAMSEGYVRIDTGTGFGRGLEPLSLQFHGEADRWQLAGAQSVASLLYDSESESGHPAVSVHEVGDGSGVAVAFAWDLPRSVIWTRQGNPAWAAQERDGLPPVRSNDLYYGDAREDPQPDWVDPDRIAVPQADELQRLLANLIVRTSLERMPLPRFWYLPDGHRAVVLMTGDHHGCCAKTAERFERYVEQSPEDCSVEDWECVRASSYLYPDERLEEFDFTRWHELGFEIGVHVDTGCADWNPASLDRRFVAPQLSLFALRAPSLPAQASERTHCIAWSDWVTRARVNAAHGIRLDTNYYFWPPEWVRDRPGLFTGSAMPMRFADLEGNLLDIYQVATQMTDESEQTYPFTAEVLLDRALGTEGYFGVFTANMHMDQSPHPGSDAIVEAALARGVPVISGRQLLRWLDGRNGSHCASLAFDAGQLRFDLVRADGAHNLQVMLPFNSAAGSLQALYLDERQLDFAVEGIKGIDCAVFEGQSGSYRAVYLAD